jgi:hypothetical protein
MNKSNKNKFSIFLKDNKIEKNRNDAFKTLLYGIISFFVGLWFCHWMIGDPISSLLLLNYSKISDGYIIDSWEDSDSDDNGVKYTYGITYIYEINGRKFTEKYTGMGRIKSEFLNLNEPFPIKIEYLPSYPSINRIKGNGAQSLFEWFWRELLLSILIYGLILTIGIKLTIKGIKDFWNLWLEYS